MIKTCSIQCATLGKWHVNFSGDEVYSALLQHHLGAIIAMAPEVLHSETHLEWIEQSITTLKGWLKLLDLAISPALIREYLKNARSGHPLDPLLRYYVASAKTAERDRDKADLLITEILRSAQGASGVAHIMQAATGYELCHEQAIAFEKNIRTILQETKSPSLPDEHNQLLRQFATFYDELDKFSSFEQLTDSGLIQRVRTVKQSFAASFYHPAVLATIAVYNVSFGQTFDHLFRQAAAELKGFAARIQKEGGNWNVPKDEQMEVAELHDEEVTHLLNREYEQAQSHFKRIARLKKAVAAQPAENAKMEPEQKPHASASGKLHAAPDVHELGKYCATAPESTGAVLAQAGNPGARHSMENAVHEARIINARDMIRSFVKVADVAKAHIVPLPVGNVVLSPSELDAFRADYVEEKSFRGEYVSALMYMTAVNTRVREEQKSFQSKRSSSYLWKPHADSLQYLLNAGQQAMEKAERLSKLAKQRGLEDKVNALQATAAKVRAQAVQVAGELQN